MRISECPVPPCIVSIWRTSVQPSAGSSTMNAVFAAWAISGSSSVRAMRMAKLARWALEMNHLWPLMTQRVAVGLRAGADQRRVGAGDLRLGHGEARPHRPLAQRAQVALLLLVGAEVQQRVHVALVGRLAVEHPRPVVGARRLGLHHRQGDVAETHAAPLGRHLRQPQAGLARRRPQGEELAVVRALVGLAQGAGVDALLGGADDVVDERPDTAAQLVELRRQAEIDRHRRGQYRRNLWAPPRPELSSDHAGLRARGRVLGDDDGVARRATPSDAAVGAQR